MQHSHRFTALVAESLKNVPEISSAEVRQKLKHGDNFSLIDVRETSEWEKGRLPNAIHLSKGIIERDIEKIIPDVNKEIVLYCGGGSRSVLAGKALKDMGYTNVFSLNGGYRCWLKSEKKDI